MCGLDDACLLVCGNSAMDYLVALFGHVLAPAFLLMQHYNMSGGMIKTGTIVFATQDDKDGRDEARAWLRDKELTPQKVRLYRERGMALVVALTELEGI